MHTARIIVCLLLPSFLAACGGRVTTTDGSVVWIGSPAFQRYAEQVFRRQNRIGQELMERQEDTVAAHKGWVRRLGLAEERLWSACLLLNEMAIAGHEGQDMDLLRQHEAALSVSACDAASGEAERLLRHPPHTSGGPPED